MNLLGHTPETLFAALEGQVPLAACRRALADLITAGKPTAEARSGLSKADLARIVAGASWERLPVLERVSDPCDASVRYLFQTADGHRVEAVRIPLELPGRFTVCLSSQVGCAMGCVFCATGRLGLARNLRADEIVSTWLTVRDEAPGRVTGAVFMGQGEPLHNYDAVKQAAAVLCHPNGGRIDARAISISTVGLVPQIRRYTEERLPYRLIVSLTSADPVRRTALLPVAGRTPLSELADALRAYTRAAPGRLTVAWVLMGGVNDDAHEVEALAALLGDLPLRLNLIDVNDNRPEGFRRATEAERHAFRDALARLRVPVVRRYSVGATQNSACGMLAAVASTA